MMEWSSLFNQKAHDDDGDFTLARPDPRWDSLRDAWRGGKNLGELFGQETFELGQGVGRGMPNQRQDVAKVETFLGRTGHHDIERTDGPTGYYGSVLDGSIRSFQTDQGLDVDGWLGPGGPTISALKGLLDCKPLPRDRPKIEPPKPPRPLSMFELIFGRPRMPDIRDYQILGRPREPDPRDYQLWLKNVPPNFEHLD
jgi:hypothetical protein